MNSKNVITLLGILQGNTQEAWSAAQNKYLSSLSPWPSRLCLFHPARPPPLAKGPCRIWPTKPWMSSLGWGQKFRN